MNQQEVQLQIVNQVFQDGGDERYEVATDGVLTTKGESFYLAYTETLPEQPDTKVVFKFKGDQVTINRHNVTKTRMVFEMGLVDPQPYQTVAGMMILATNTQKMEIEFDEATGTGQLDLSYSLTANGDVVGQYQVALQFGPKSSILN
ncbi:hypothetical protein FPFC_013360 [Fructobacillus pseudoficulneus]|uniref:DUF1934 domain-containing protein n=1 Tax=Fructobacillus pseudoficulneus TaxID=220714 RepID=A0A3F3GS50_9LACO|nr:DUF1934 domain-containing protein [Fructobacillus pseudoficulneus]GAP02454.1 hypothetical protein FPFC_013360 [Fructobacillus pseudoficulneus]